MSQYAADPWELRNRYISVINDRSAENIENFLSSPAGRDVCYDEKVMMLKLLEMERHSLLMYTSCGWFFDDISGIESVQIMQYASRAIQLAKEVTGKDVEPRFKEILEQAPSNEKRFANGKQAYETLAKPASIDLTRVGAHFAISSLFDKYSPERDVYCYSAKVDAYDRVDAGIQVLATGRAAIQSNIVLERHPVDFAVLHFGDHNLICAVNARIPDDAFAAMRRDLKNAFARGDTTEIMRLMNISFGGNSYSVWHLFKDEQRRILNQLLETTWKEIEASFRQIYEHDYTIMQIMRGMNIPLPKVLSTPAEFILNQDLRRAIQEEEIDLGRLRRLAEEATRLSLQLDEATLRFEASHRFNSLMNKLEESPGDVKLLERIEETLNALLVIVPTMDLDTAQNILFAISKTRYVEMNRKADAGDATAKRWVELIKDLAQCLDIEVG
jgi:hypothetical protein